MKRPVASLALIAIAIALILTCSDRFRTARDIYVTWEGERASIRGEASGGLKWQITRGAVTMTASETVGKQLKVHLSGTSENGSFELDTKKKTLVVLDGLKLHNPAGTAIELKSDKETIIVLADSTENELSDEGIDANGDLELRGYGQLTIRAQLAGNKGIRTEGSFRVKDEPTLIITTTGQPLSMRELAMPDLPQGNEGDGHHPGPPPAGFERYDYSGTAKAIKALGKIVIEGGTIRLNTHTPGAEGMESKRDIIINGGDIEVHAHDDAINAGMTMTVNGGKIVAVSSNNDGIDINGGTMKPWVIEPPKGYDAQRAAAIKGQPRYTQTGGSVTAITQAPPPEEGLDTDHTPIEHTGGELIIVPNDSIDHRAPAPEPPSPHARGGQESSES